MMKIALAITIVLLLNLLNCAQKRPRNSTEHKLSLFVTIPPQKYFVEKIGGKYVEVQSLVPPGASPHTFEPKPAQMVSLTKADCYFTIGLELEEVWMVKIKKINPGLKVVPTDSGIQKMAMKEHGEEDEHHHTGECSHSGLDPHIWLAPSLVKIQAQTIAASLCAIDAPNAAWYQKQLLQFVDEIDSLSSAIREMLVSCKANNILLTFHPSWGYFAKDFSLQQIAIEAEGKEPGLRELGSIVATVKGFGSTAIFVQPQFSKKIAHIIAEEVHAEVIIADPMAEVWADNLLTISEHICK